MSDDSIRKNQSVELFADRVCREVAELPDRNSPADWPQAMLVTQDELKAIVCAAATDLLEAGWNEGFHDAVAASMKPSRTADSEKAKTHI